jgi:hypothetical protein
MRRIGAMTVMVSALPALGQATVTELSLPGFDSVDGTLNDFRGWHVDGIHITATGSGCSDPVCYPNCDGSTIAPILNVLDFNCFLSRFSAGDSYANCDGSTIVPVLNVLDFNCFLNAFGSGQPYANCDQSTSTPVLNVLDFNCFLNAFSLGCP